MATREEVIANCDAFTALVEALVNDNSNREVSPADVRQALDYLNEQIRTVAEEVGHWGVGP